MLLIWWSVNAISSFKAQLNSPLLQEALPDHPPSSAQVGLPWVPTASVLSLTWCQGRASTLGGLVHCMPGTFSWAGPSPVPLLGNGS
jgi:hypothetical protein